MNNGEGSSVDPPTLSRKPTELNHAFSHGKGSSNHVPNRLQGDHATDSKQRLNVDHLKHCIEVENPGSSLHDHNQNMGQDPNHAAGNRTGISTNSTSSRKHTTETPTSKSNDNSKQNNGEQSPQGSNIFNVDTINANTFIGIQMNNNR